MIEVSDIHKELSIIEHSFGKLLQSLVQMTSNKSVNKI